jgi:hypothetical protein
MGNLIHSSSYKPKVIPVNGLGSWSEIDRVQSIDKTGTLNRIKVEEVGRDGVVDYIKQTPSVGYRMTQLEYGSLEFFNRICNKADANTSLTLSDFKTSTFDICAYKDDDAGTFKSTLWLPKLRTAGFGINIGSPTGLIERSFDFIGEDWIEWQGNNKYLIFRQETVESGEFESGNTVHYNLSGGTYPAPVADPDDTDKYILRVVRVRSGTATELTATTDYYYEHDDTELLVYSCQVGDTINIWYTATTYISGSNPFTENDSDLAGIHADSASIYLATNNYVYRLQSIALDVRFEREDIFEVGNNVVVSRGIRNKTVTYTLGRILEALTIEEVLRGKSADYGKLDIRQFATDLATRVYIYANNSKNTGDFKIGFKSTDLTPSEIRGGAANDTYVNQGNTLEGENLTISNVKGTIDA